MKLALTMAALLLGCATATAPTALAPDAPVTIALAFSTSPAGAAPGCAIAWVAADGERAVTVGVTLSMLVRFDP